MKRSRIASESLPAPPSGAGNPMVWPSMISSRPRKADPAPSKGMSVGDEVRMQVSITAYGAPNLRLRLEQQGLPAGVSQPIGRHQPVGTCADDDRVYLTRQRHALPPEATQSIGRPPVTAIRAPEM